MNKKIENILKTVLLQKEIAVYSAAMKGIFSVQELSQKTGIDRVQIYQIIKSLTKKGLVHQNIRKHGRDIVAEHPRKLVNLLANKQRNLRRQELTLQELLPQMLVDYNTEQHKPKVAFFEGIEGFKSIMNQLIETLKQNNLKEYKILAPTNSFLEMLEQHCSEIKKERIELKIKMKLITSESELARKRQKIDQEELRQRKILSSQFKFSSVIILYGGNIAIFNLQKEIIGLIIENNSIHQTFDAFFDFMWEALK